MTVTARHARWHHRVGLRVTNSSVATCVCRVRVLVEKKKASFWFDISRTWVNLRASKHKAILLSVVCKRDGTTNGVCVAASVASIYRTGPCATHAVTHNRMQQTVANTHALIRTMVGGTLGPGPATSPARAQRSFLCRLLCVCVKLEFTN